MREGARDNRRQQKLNPQKRTLDAPERGLAQDGYRCLSQAVRGRPREELSDPMRFDEGAWNSVTYPDL